MEPGDPTAVPDGRIRLDRVATRPGVAVAAGDAAVEVTAARADGRAVTASAEGRTLLRPWVPDPRLNPYRLEAGRAPAADGEVAVVQYMSRAGKVRVGDTLTLTLPRQTRRVRVSGVVSVQGRDAVAAGNLVLAPPETVRRASMLPAGTWQSVWVKAAPGVPADPLREELARDLGGAATVRTAASVRDAQTSAAAGEGARSPASSACSPQWRCSSACSWWPTRSARWCARGPGGSRSSGRSAPRRGRSNGSSAWRRWCWARSPRWAGPPRAGRCPG